MLTAKELSEQRSVATSWLPDTCDIAEIGTTTDALGGITSDTTPVATNVPCFVEPMNGSEGDSDQRGEAVTRYSIVVPRTQALKVDYVITHGGVDYQVVSTEVGHTYDTLNRAIMVKLNDG